MSGRSSPGKKQNAKKNKAEVDANDEEFDYPDEGEYEADGDFDIIEEEEEESIDEEDDEEENDGEVDDAFEDPNHELSEHDDDSDHSTESDDDDEKNQGEKQKKRHGGKDARQSVVKDQDEPKRKLVLGALPRRFSNIPGRNIYPQTGSGTVPDSSTRKSLARRPTSSRIQTKLMVLTSTHINSGNNSSTVSTAAKKIAAAAKRRPTAPVFSESKLKAKYNRTPYPIASIEPTNNESENRINSHQPPADSIASTENLISKKQASINSKKGSSTQVIVGYAPVPSSGLGFIPVSEHDNNMKIRSGTSDNSSQRNGTAASSKKSTQDKGAVHKIHNQSHTNNINRSLPPWDMHTRRMEYDKYVRSASRQSADESRMRSKLEKQNEKRLTAGVQESQIQGDPQLLSEDESKDYVPEILVPVGTMGAGDNGRKSVTIRKSVTKRSFDGELEDDAINSQRDSTANPPCDGYYSSGKQASEFPTSIDLDTSAAPEGLDALMKRANSLARIKKEGGRPKVNQAIQEQLQNRPRSIGSPGDVLFGRRGSLHAIPTIMQLTQSEMNLFQNSTGQFRGGIRDPHVRFLRRTIKGVKLSGPNGSIPVAIAPTYKVVEKKTKERTQSDFFGKHSKRIQNAQAMKEMQWEFARKKYVVGKGTGGFSKDENVKQEVQKDEKVEEHELRLLKVSNPIKYKRYIEKEKAKSFLLTKWETLEQLRIQIVAKTTSLKNYHEYYNGLLKENKELQAIYNGISQRTNDLISKTLEQNELATLDIIRIDREKKRQYAILKGTYDEFLAKSEAEILKLSNDEEKTRKTVERISQEIFKIMDFKSLKESNPKALANKVKEAGIKRDEYIKQLKVDLEQITVDWNADQTEIEQTWMSKVKSLIDKMGDSLKVHVDNSPTGHYHQNGRLRHEISIHSMQATKAEKEIADLLAARKIMQDRSAFMKDRRRRVLSLKEQMTCTPDMEFEVSQKNLLIKELGI